MTCGEQIKREREKRRLSQEELAEQMEVSRQAVSKWESNRSRPTREKLERLSALFGLPPESWEPSAPPEQAALRRWKRISAVLAAALCLTLAAGWFLWPAPEPDFSYMFPRTLPLDARVVEDFGQMILPARDVTGEGENILTVQFPDSSVCLGIFRADPVQENGTTFYEVYAQSFDADGESGKVTLGRLTDRNHYVNDGLDGAEAFNNVLGHSGWKITLREGAACVTSWYFCADPESGAVRLLLTASGSDTPQEQDVDGDGQKEIVTSFGMPVSWEICDDRFGGRCVSFWLDQEDYYSQVPLTFSAAEGFIVTDRSGAVKARYCLERNQMALQYSQ